MAAAERHRVLFEQIVRLRNAERAHPTDRDIAAVRSELERELGPVVSMSLAADVLGVSHTTVGRWVRAGEIPKLTAPSGRSGVPVQSLLRLRDEVERERKAGRRSLHLIEPIVTGAREKALRLDPRDLLADVNLDGEPLDPHERGRLRSLAYHRLVAGQLTRAMVDDAIHRIWTWRDEGHVDHRYADEWEVLLAEPLIEIRRVLSENSQRADDLRQNSPFAGVVSEPERRRILDVVA